MAGLVLAACSGDENPTACKGAKSYATAEPGQSGAWFGQIVDVEPAGQDGYALYLFNGSDAAPDERFLVPSIFPFESGDYVCFVGRITTTPQAYWTVEPTFVGPWKP